MFNTIYDKELESEIIEKKSKFIANVYYVESIEEAEKKINYIKKKYFDARHNCYAYSIFDNENIINKFSDDGEPSGTAGAPMLNILNARKITNCVVVVTRYFGGILLGTGGLVRAYTSAMQEALDKTKIIEKNVGVEVKMTLSYSDLEKLKYYLKQNEIGIISFEYTENVSIVIELTKEKLNFMLSSRENLNFKIEDYKILKEKYI